ncbi:Prenylcysteine lyase-domain-containing protein [Infundibulicybe gibba]|nr:Prenylcysteine lyase-domain-containing protein [Infundibulicybe gibba]
MRPIGILLLVSGTSFAFQFPFKFPFKTKAPAAEVIAAYAPPRVAIIGAGAGGSSAAFWISKAKERFGVDVEVDVYEQEAYIGGRSTVVFPHNNRSLPAIELGASIFVQANKNLWRASDQFNLTRRDFKDETSDIGVWDGEKLLLSFDGGWMDTAKILWRYGITAPRRTNALVADMIKEFLTLYSPESPKWDDIADLAETLGWTKMTQRTTSAFFEEQGISKKYINELVEGSTRVNYGQNADELHALEGACSMATSGAAGIQGGNFQIFEQFLKRSGAKVYLNTTVSSITPKSANSRKWTVRSGRGVVDYRSVILAAPYHSTNITLPNSIVSQIPRQPYVRLHVTLLTTTSPSFDPEYFGLQAGAKVPSMMLTTYQGVREGGKEPEFNSISYHGPINDGEWVVKIFSQQRVSDEWLEKIFPGAVTWVHRKEWDAYPKLPPTSTFPPVKLDSGMYYVNAFEPFISTMETETIASRNVVDLLLNEEFGSSICGSRISAQSSQHRSTNSTPTSDTFVLGWDC